MEKNKNRHTILVVEDEEPILRVIIEKLSLHNFNTITAGTIEDALNTLQDEARIDASHKKKCCMETSANFCCVQYRRKRQNKTI